MRIRSRSLIALVAGALLALAVAVPVVALAHHGVPASDGATRLYHYTGAAGEWQAQPPSTVRLTWSHAIEPYFLRFTLVGARLAPGPYTLVNVLAIEPESTPLSEHVAVVSVLARGCANRAGVLKLRGSAGSGGAAPPLLSAGPDYEEYMDVFGADVWLVPSRFIDEHGHVMLPNAAANMPQPEFLYTAAGLPFDGYYQPGP